MTNQPKARPFKLGLTLDRYRQGVAFFNQALKAFEANDVNGYETSLRKSVTEIIGSLEWAIKVYLRGPCRSRLSIDEQKQLKHPNFNVLMDLMQRHATPTITPNEISEYYGYREELRNAAEHNAAIPCQHDLRQAIMGVGSFISKYLEPIEPPNIFEFSESANEPKNDIIRYLKTIEKKFEFLDLGGISPKVGSRVVKLRLKDLYTPLHAQLEEGSRSVLAKGNARLEVSDPEKAHSAILSESSEAASETIDIVSHAHSGASPINRIEISEIFSHSRVVILGHPGAGKSTLARYIAFCIAKRIEPIASLYRGKSPIVVRAAEYGSYISAKPTTSLFKYIVGAFTETYGTTLQWILSNNRALVIIDGLDEIADPVVRSKIPARLNDFSLEFPGIKIIVTSRIIGYQQNRLSQDFVHVTLEEFDDQSIQAFLESWHIAVERESIGDDITAAKKKSYELLRAIERNRGIYRLARNPLLLTIIALANWRGTKLPSRRVELYAIATETLIENWPLKQRNISLQSEDILQILEPVAFRIFETGKDNAISSYELRPLFEDQVRDIRGVSKAEARVLSRELLKTVEEHTGFFLERGFDDGGQRIYGFLHTTFGEYLTARHMAERWSAGDLDFDEFLHRARWHEVLLLMAGHIGTWAIAQATSLARSLLNIGSPFESILHRDLLFVAEIISDNVRVKREIFEEVSTRLIQIALFSEFAELRYSVLQCLKRLSNAGSFDEDSRDLLDFTGNVTIDNRRAEIRLLQDSDDEEAFSLLLKQIGKDSDEEPLSYLHRFLLKIGKDSEKTGIFYYASSSMLMPIHIGDFEFCKIQKVLGQEFGSYSIKQALQAESTGSPVFILANFDEISKWSYDLIADLIRSPDWKITHFISIVAMRNPKFYSCIVDELASYQQQLGSREQGIIITQIAHTISRLPDNQQRASIFNKFHEACFAVMQSGETAAIKKEAFSAILLLPQKSLTIDAQHIITNFDGGDFKTTLLEAFLNHSLVSTLEFEQWLCEQLISGNPELEAKAAAVLLISNPATLFNPKYLLEKMNDGKEALSLALSPKAFHEIIKRVDKSCLGIYFDETIREIFVSMVRKIEPEHIFFWHYNMRERSEQFSPGVNRSLSPLLNHTSMLVRRLVIKILGQEGFKDKNLEIIVKLLSDEDAELRADAARAIRAKDLEDESIRSTMFKLLKDPNDEVAFAASTVLAHRKNSLDRPEVERHLIAGIESGQNAQACFRGLRRLHDEDEPIIPFFF